MPNPTMKDPKGYLTKEEIQAMIDTAATERDKILIYTLAMTGRRISEVVRNLRPMDIDFDNNLINYTILKRRKDTKMLLPAKPELVRALNKYIVRYDIEWDQPIFTIGRRRAHQIVRRIGEKAGIQKSVHPHMFRHSFAIAAAKNTENVPDFLELKELMGHSRLDSTMFYMRFYPRKSKELLDKTYSD